MMNSEALSIVDAIRSEIDLGITSILTETEAGLRELLNAPGIVDSALAERLRDHLCAILEACSVQDLTGQRLSVLTRLLSRGGDTAPQDALLNGPAMAGMGLDQAAADMILDV